MDDGSRKIKVLSIMVIILLLVVVGLLIYIMYDIKQDRIPVDTTVIDDKTPKKEESEDKSSLPKEVIEFPQKNDVEVVVKKVSDLNEEDIIFIEKHGDHVPEVEEDGEEPLIYFYKDHIIKYWNTNQKGYTKLVVDNSLVDDYVVFSANDLKSDTKVKTVPVIKDGVLHVISKSAECFKYEDSEVNKLSYYTVTLDEKFENETTDIITFEAMPEGEAEGPECDMGE